MPKYLSLLRGINVSGHKKILMKDLKVLYEGLGFKRIQTYIQSGNVIFETSLKNPAKKIEEKIEKEYKFQVSVIIRTIEELQNAITKNPFVKDKSIGQKRLYITFLSVIPKAEHIEKLNQINYEPEKFIIKEKEVFIYTPNGYGEAKFSNNFIENKLKVTATTRNWKVVNELFELVTN